LNRLRRHAPPQATEHTMSKLHSERGERGTSAPARRIELTSHCPAPSDGGDEELHWITTRDQFLIRDFRHVMRENQTAFWRRFGVTQSCGSRFERGNAMPLAVLMLLRLYLRRKLDDADLVEARSHDDGDGRPL
jgi:hypothetical protein